MANNKKLVEAITSMEEDFAQWYTDVVKKADLIDYTSVKGCMAVSYTHLDVYKRQLRYILYSYFAYIEPNEKR